MWEDERRKEKGEREREMTTAGSGVVGGGRAFDNPREWVKGDVAGRKEGGREGMKGMREGDERECWTVGIVGSLLERWIVDGCMCYVDVCVCVSMYVDEFVYVLRDTMWVSEEGAGGG